MRVDGRTVATVFLWELLLPSRYSRGRGEAAHGSSATRLSTRLPYKSVGENVDSPKTTIFLKEKLQLFKIGEDPGEESAFTGKV